MIDQLFSVRGKIILVTGGSRGIGYHFARAFVENGARVYITARKVEACDAAATRLGKYGECLSLPADVTTPEGRQLLVSKLGEREHELHILVNNAGATWGARFGEYSAEGWDKVVDTNLKAPFLLLQDLLPLLRAAARPADPARVINVGSVDGLTVPFTANYAYSASKAGLHHLTRHLASALAPEGITVNAIAPGLFESKMTAFMFNEMSTSKIAEHIPLGRPGAYEDIAGAALYLASRAGAWITGAVIPVSGGIATASGAPAVPHMPKGGT